MIKKNLNIDNKDVSIISAYAKNPSISQTELAKELSISQPSINARLQKLRKKGAISQITGIDFTKAKLYLVRADFTTTNAKQTLENLSKCSFFVNGFVMSGKHNASIIIASHNLEKAETIVNKHLRANPLIKDIETTVLVSSIKPFICSLDLEKEEHEECQNPNSCAKCPMHKE